MLKRGLISKNKLIYLVILITFLTHTSYLFNGFTWLDHGDIETGRSIVTLTNLSHIFLRNFGQTGFYRPLVSFLNSIDKALYFDLAYGFHLTNVLLHLGVVYTTYLFSQLYFKLNIKQSLLAALIVGVHPISWLPVGAISYRSEIMVSLFSLLSIVFHIKARSSRNKSASLAYIFIILAFFSKETAIFWVPFLIFVWEIKRQGKFLFKLKRIHFVEASLIVFYLFLRFLVAPKLWSPQWVELPLNQAVGTRLLVLSKQLVFLLSPLKPSLSDATNLTSFLGLIPVFTLLSIFSAVYLISKLKFKNTYSQVAIFTFIALFPAQNLIPLPRFNSPHYAYFATIGFGVLLSFLYFEVRENSGVKQEMKRTRNKAGGKNRQPPRLGMLYFQLNLKVIKVFSFVLVIWIFVAMTSTFLAGFRFKNDLTLFIPETEKDKNFLEGHFYIADYYLKNNEFEKAEARYELAIKQHSQVIAYVDRYSTVLNLAGVKLGLEKYSEAEELLVDAINRIPEKKDQKLIYNLALVYWYKGDNWAVVNTLSQEEEWESPEPLLLAARAYISLGEKEKAVNLFKKALKFLDLEERQKLESLIEDGM